MKKLFIKVRDGEESLILIDSQFEPLSLDNFIEFTERGSVAFKVKNATALSSDGAALGTANMTGDFTTHLENKCYALVEGGWLPPLFALEKALIIPDRNIISEISRRFQGGTVVARKDGKEDFFDLFSEQTHGAKISLAPFALENNTCRRRPTKEEVISQLREADAKIARALPTLERIPINDQTVLGIMNILEEARLRFDQRMEFLLKCAPHLMSTAGKIRRLEAWKSIATIAAAVGLPRDDLTVIAAMSAVTAKGKYNPAKGIIKPSQAYTQDNAYNALCDFQLVSLFIHLIRYALHPKPVLLTKDVSLAQFWAGITPIVGFRQTGSGVSCQFPLHQVLFPLDEYWQEELKAILGT